MTITIYKNELGDALSDVVTHALAIDSLEIIKITGTDDETFIQGMSTKGITVCFNGWLDTPLKDLKGEFGMTSLDVLRGLVRFTSFKTEEASVDVVRRDKNGEEEPTEISFNDGKGTKAVYRLMNKDIIPKQPRFIGSDWTWDVEVELSKSKIAELSQVASIYSKFQSDIITKVRDGKLYFCFGDEESSTHRAEVIVSDVSGKLTNRLIWPESIIMNILKMVDDSRNVTGTVKIHNEKKVMTIVLKSKYARYEYTMKTKEEVDV